MGSDVAVSLHACQGPAETAAAGVTQPTSAAWACQVQPRFDTLACNNN